MRSILSAALSAFALLTAPAAAQSAPAAQAGELARALDAHTAALMRQGYALAAGPLVGAARQRGDIQVRLWAGQDYVLAGACESQCGALALRVIDPNGEIVSETEAGAAPVLALRPTVTGRHTLQARMPNCRAVQCWFAVNVYAR